MNNFEEPTLPLYKSVFEKRFYLWPIPQSEIDKNISLYNSMVMGMHNYYCMATMVSADFAEIA